MATENSIPTFRNASDFRTLLITLEELAIAALEESDNKRRAAVLWSMQKLSETAAKDAELFELAGG